MYSNQDNVDSAGSILARGRLIRHVVFPDGETQAWFCKELPWQIVKLKHF